MSGLPCSVLCKSSSSAYTRYLKTWVDLIPQTRCLHRNTYKHAANICSTNLKEFEEFKHIKNYEELYNFSLERPDKFWGHLAKRLEWMKPHDKVMDCDMMTGKFRWFEGGQLNVSVNCLDRHVKVHPDKTAFIWEKDEPGQQEVVTYKELLELTCKIANILKDYGVKRGDAVVLYMPVSPMAAAVMLACARIGAPHSVVFAGFSAQALASRIQDADAKTVITVDQGVRGGKIIDLKRTVDAAVAMCPSVSNVFVGQRTGNTVSTTPLDIQLEPLIEEASPVCDPEPMNSEDVLFLLYTSGSTGKPKGIVHTQAGYLLYTNITHKLVFDYKDNDIFACMADVGWITGHSYGVYGPLSNGATSVLFESTPTYPDPGRYWEMVERLRINQFYTAPTAIRLLLKSGDSWVTKYDRSSLRLLGTVGEPINREAWDWYHQIVGAGHVPVVDTWWQTETGGICIAPRPSAPGAEIKPAMAMRSLPGIDVLLLDSKGQVCDGDGVNGALCIRRPWPGMARTIHGSHSRFLETYYSAYPGFYFTGDAAYRDHDGFYHITGRMDDVLNISGHRLGTAEIEDILDQHSTVAESAVIGFPHELTGEGVYAYVTLKDGVDTDIAEIEADLRSLVKHNIASYAVPEFIQFTSNLPKTRSGKIMRRILRKIAANKFDELGDTSTLAEPAVVDSLIANHKLIINNNN